MGKYHRFMVRDKVRLASSIANFGRQRILCVVYFYCILATLWFTYMYSELGKEPPSQKTQKVDDRKDSKAARKPPKDVGNPLAFKPLSAEAATFVKFALTTALTERNRRSFLRTLREFDSIWRLKLGRPYHMYCGTLLGAVRHQGFIPYDNNVDLIADRRDMPLMTTAFMGTPLDVHQDGRNRRKISLREGANRTPRGWLDVSFYKFLGNSSAIQDLGVSSYRLPTSLVFPTKLLPFEGSFFPAPRCYYRALEVVFGRDFLNKCCLAIWNHRAERYGSDPSGPCIGCRQVFHFFNVSLTPLAREPERACRV